MDFSAFRSTFTPAGARVNSSGYLLWVPEFSNESPRVPFFARRARLDSLRRITSDSFAGAPYLRNVWRG